MFSFPEAAQTLNCPLEFPHVQCFASGASIDTRKLEPGNLFIALVGAKTDGHQFLKEAFRKGASGAIVLKSSWELIKRAEDFSDFAFQNVLVVEDPNQAFLDLAHWYRLKINPVTIGITGSVGKTTTKEFLAYLLKKKHPVLATEGNFNNHLGLPLTLLSLQESDRFCVAEIGANQQGDIKQLTQILKPDHVILTFISEAHLKGLGSLEAIYEEKLEIVKQLRDDSFVVLPSHDRNLISKLSPFSFRKMTVGPHRSADHLVSDIHIENGKTTFSFDEKTSFSFPGVASFMAENAGLALAMAESLGICLEDIPEKWDDFSLLEGRFTARKIPGDIQVIHDGYNASPYSFTRSLDAFSALEIKGKKILVFSDMLELGEHEKDLHAQLGDEIAKQSYSFVLGYGALAAYTVERIKVTAPHRRTQHFRDPLEIVPILKENLCEGDAVLFKGSRGMQVERIITQLNEELSHSFK